MPVMSDAGSTVTDGRFISFGSTVHNESELRVCGDLRGKRVLDVCCYTGGFGLNCLVNGGAAEVVAVDASASALFW
jgi:23S rRNA G2069 N7-methylase RlmK/C1962 C5-methylase RlmI